MRHRIVYSDEAIEHLRLLAARERGEVVGAVERSLAAEPTLETRHRKRMRPNPIAPWELRVGDLRVYYDVKASDERDAPEVQVLAVGRKDRNRVLIAGEEIDL